MKHRDRTGLVAIEIRLTQADYLKQRYRVKTHTAAVRLALEDFCTNPEIAEAISFDKANALTLTKENQVRLMQATGYRDWRYAALEILGNYLQQHYNEQEQEDVKSIS